METLKDHIKDHPLPAIAITAVVVFLFMLLITIITGLSLTKKENMELPWNRKREQLFSGDLTPSQMAMYKRLASADPVRTEYMRNKEEVPVLVSTLYQ